VKEEGENIGGGGQLREKEKAKKGRGKGRRDGREGDEKGRINLAPTVISESRRLWL